jgi:GNAT superfamily N-acetyltransferase
MSGPAPWAILDGGLEVHHTRDEHADGLAELQRIVFPTLAPAQRFAAEHYRHHVAMFPAGQLCIVDPAAGRRVVGMTSTIRYPLDLEHAQHGFDDIIQGGWLTAHDPAGRWLYGADVGVHPAYRGRGLARALYAARHATVRALGLDGQVTVGMPSGYGALADRMTAQQYYDELLAGTRTDPTISAQRAIGFEPHGLIADYIDDPVCASYGVLLILPASRDVPLPTLRPRPQA